MDWAGERICVIGGGGMLGMALLKSLRARGAQHVTVLDNGKRAGRLAWKREALADRVHPYQLLYRSARYMGDAWRAMEGCSIVLNLAANVAGISHNIGNQAKMLVSNAEIKFGVYKAIEYAQPRTFVDISTACVTPHDAPIPTPESAIAPDHGPWDPEPSNFGYGIAKLVGEFLTWHASVPHRIIVRPSNMYGPHDYFGPGCHVIPALIQRIRGGENPLQLWGGGQQTRSFLYVDDAAESICQLIEVAPDRTVCNIGADDEVSIETLAGLIASVWHGTCATMPDTSKPAGYARRQPDLTAARAYHLACVEKPTTLVRGLHQMVEWWEKEEGTSCSHV